MLGIKAALIYPTVTFQSRDEIVELAKIAAQYGGNYGSHIRDESGGLLVSGIGGAAVSLKTEPVYPHGHIFQLLRSIQHSG
ncbi:hypothetical protein [Haliea sp.]